jgi:hypothetical protein
MAPLLAIAGYILILIGSFVILVAAFRQSVLWGLACLFLPVVQLFFLIVHWRRAKQGFALQLCGAVFLLSALFLVPILKNA